MRAAAAAHDEEQPPAASSRGTSLAPESSTGFPSWTWLFPWPAEAVRSMVQKRRWCRRPAASATGSRRCTATAYRSRRSTRGPTARICRVPRHTPHDGSCAVEASGRSRRRRASTSPHGRTTRRRRGGTRPPLGRTARPGRDLGRAATVTKGVSVVTTDPRTGMTILDVTAAAAFDDETALVVARSTT
jgi:hypothetical protein